MRCRARRYAVAGLVWGCMLLPVSAAAQVSDCDIDVDVGTTPEIGAIQIDLGYDSSAGFILGAAADAQCSTLIVYDLETHNHDLEAATVHSAIVTLEPLVGPATILRCRFRATEGLPNASDFSAVAVETVAPAPSFASLPNPSLSVRVGACEGVVTTTTTTSTTTTTMGTTTSSTTTTTTTTTSSTTTTTLAVGGQCGLPLSQGPLPTATDALAVLRAAVGLYLCAPCVCDADGSGAITATDALLVLRAAVGIADARNCPPCD